jgi:hypothetical protein
MTIHSDNGLTVFSADWSAMQKGANAWVELLKAELPSDLSRNRGNNAAMLIAGFLRARAWQSSGAFPFSRSVFAHCLLLFKRI